MTIPWTLTFSLIQPLKSKPCFSLITNITNINMYYFAYAQIYVNTTWWVHFCWWSICGFKADNSALNMFSQYVITAILKHFIFSNLIYLLNTVQRHRAEDASNLLSHTELKLPLAISHSFGRSALQSSLCFLLKHICTSPARDCSISKTSSMIVPVNFRLQQFHVPLYTFPKWFHQLSRMLNNVLSQLKSWQF